MSQQEKNLIDIHQHRIVIIDFGSQYSQLIARRVRELGVFCEILNPQSAVKTLAEKSAKGIILSGGPESAHDSAAPGIPQIVFDLQVPVLGICYGMQAMAQQLGGEVVSGGAAEFGHAQIEILDDSHLFSAILESDNAGTPAAGLFSDAWMSHGDHVQRLPQGFIATAKTKEIPFAAMADHKRKLYGLQFHPEVTHTKAGKDIFNNFVSEICKCKSTWTAENIINAQIDSIRKKVGGDKVVLGLSGGVDSSVCAALLQRAIGDQLICIFVDTGLLRQDEATEVEAIFAKHMGMNLITVKAHDLFYDALAGLEDPEEKRKAVGHAFIKVFSEQAKGFPDCKYLAQGTIYPDVIESAAANTSHAKVIKSHHNVGGLPDDMPFKLIEPLRELFKDEVRLLGTELGLDDILLQRHPFPGPGLCVRILGEIKQPYVQILQQADAIFIKELREHNLYNQVSQAFAVFLPVKAVGVKGDGRCYEYVIALRAVETVDFMTATWSRLPYDFLEIVANKIMNTMPKVARVVYDISGKPPATIEWE